MSKNTLTITDNRTGKTYEIPVADGTIRTADLRQIKTSPEDFGLMGYDPAFMNTASCRSSITYIDGDAGILRYRGYDIADLAEKSTHLEVSYLLLNGELPTKAQLDAFTREITLHTFLHENVKAFIDGGSEVLASTPAEHAAAVKEQYERWGGVIRKLGLKLD